MHSGNNSNSHESTSRGTSGLSARGRVALLMPYWSFWESSVPWDLRADREQLLTEAVAIASQCAEVSLATLLTDPDSTDSAMQQATDVDAIVIVSTMAVPSSTTTKALDMASEAPVLVWALSRSDHVTSDFSHTDITTAGSSVGTPMITSALARDGRPFDVVATSLSQTEGILRALRRTITAGQILRRPFLAIGEPIPGYTTVVPPDASQTFPGRVTLAASVLTQATATADVAAVEHRITQIRGQFQVDSAVTEASLTKAAQVEVGLRDIVDKTGTLAGTINCHDPTLRGNASFGFAPCLALGRLTTDGVPFTCTGDLLTALAMAAVRGLGHPALYHEVEAFDFEAGEIILANSGEHDLSLCSGVAQLVPNNWFLDDPIVGPCARYSLPPGPASLVAFVMVPEPRFVVAEGEFTDRQFPATGVANGAFRFFHGCLEEAWTSWILAGVTHHSVATSGHVAEEIAVIARLMSADFVKIS